jgi:hypothetical protein
MRRSAVTEQQTARLKAIFERAMRVTLAAAPLAVCGGCSAGAAANASGSDAAIDAFTRGDASARSDASADAGGSDEDRWAPGCQPGTAEPFDAGSDAMPGCEYAIPLPCGLPAWVTSVAPPLCFLDETDCAEICKTPSPWAVFTCKVANGFGCDDEAGAFVAPDGAPIVIECEVCPSASGRRPPGLADRPAHASADPLGRFLAHSAFLEAASVDAFQMLARELRASGAPRSLVDAARRSARDETRHARVMTRLARAHGCEPPRPFVARTPRRALVDMAVENAREGCVRETFGALLATWQSAHARDRRVASAMKRIAADETRHAALAWAVADWMAPRLDAKGRRRVASERRKAADALRAELQARPSPSLVRRAGIPTRRAALELYDQLLSTLWT